MYEYTYSTKASINGRIIPTELIYSEEDPFAVQFKFYSDGKTTTWYFSYELFIKGRKSSRWVGLGDIQVKKAKHSIMLKLHGQDHSATVGLIPEDVDAFLNSFDPVELDFEEELEDLIRGN